MERPLNANVLGVVNAIQDVMEKHPNNHSMEDDFGRILMLYIQGLREYKETLGFIRDVEP